jgi:hypothetical protein
VDSPQQGSRATPDYPAADGLALEERTDAPRSFLEPPSDLGSEPMDDVISSVTSDGPKAPFWVSFDPEIGRPVVRRAGLAR